MIRFISLLALALLPFAASSTEPDPRHPVVNGKRVHAHPPHVFVGAPPQVLNARVCGPKPKAKKEDNR